MSCNASLRTIYHSDNLDILRGINSKCIDLIYLDPPFNKNQMFYAIFEENGKKKKAGYKDVWNKEDIKDDWTELIQDQWPKLYQYFNGIENIGIKGAKYYLIYMAIRLIEMYRILKDTGSIYYHCDPTMSHYIKIMMDCIFGEDKFRNEIVWHYFMGGKSKNFFARKHDIILFYIKDKNYSFSIDTHKRRLDFKPSLSNPYDEERVGKDELGFYSVVKIDDVWDIKGVFNMSNEYVPYPTQNQLHY